MAVIGRQRLLLGVAFVLVLAATFFFGFRVGRHARRLRWQNEPIRAWMTVPFIAHTRHVRPDVLFRALGLPPHPHDRRPVRQIARAEHRPVDDVIRDLEDAIANAHGRAPDQHTPGNKGP